MEEKPLKRNNYFARRLLGVEDFTAEQQYFLSQHRRHNRLLHGWGVVSGLGLSISGDSVVVGPGFALDRRGNEILVPYPHVSKIAAVACRTLYVALRYADKAVDPVPASSPDGSAFSRVEESFEVSLEATDPRGRPQMDAVVPLGELRRGRGGWFVDSSFRPTLLRGARKRGSVGGVILGAALGLLSGILLSSGRRK